MTESERNKIENVALEIHGRGYTEGLKDGYDKGAEDAWECARKIALNASNGGISISDMRLFFGTSSLSYILKNNSVQEVIDKIKEYEEERKKGKEDVNFEVGDKVRTLTDMIDGDKVFPEGTIGVIKNIDKTELPYQVYSEKYDDYYWYKKGTIELVKEEGEE